MVRDIDSMEMTGISPDKVQLYVDIVNDPLDMNNVSYGLAKVPPKIEMSLIAW
jgi:hypothetical protein